MIFIGIDPGLNWGCAVFAKEQQKICWSKKFQSLADFETEIENLIHEHRPDAMLTCRGMGPNTQVIRVHSAMAAFVELVCEREGIGYFDVPDNSIRKTVMGKGNAKKQEVMDFLGLTNEHAADAMLGAMYLQNKLTP